MEKESQTNQSREFLEQLAIEAVAKNRYPNAKIKEILPGFEAGEGNYVWLVIMETETPFDNNLVLDPKSWTQSNVVSTKSLLAELLG